MHHCVQLVDINCRQLKLKYNVIRFAYPSARVGLLSL